MSNTNILSRSTLRPLSIALAMVLSFGALAGCLGGGAEENAIVIGSPGGWTGEEIRSHMVAKVLEDELGQKVDLREQLQAGVIYTSLADAKINVFVGAWLPLQDASYSAQPEGSIKILGDNLPPESVTLSLAVPKYVHDAGVRSLADLDAHKDKFGGKIMGIEPGAGMMQVAKTRTAMDVYGLADWEIVDSSTPAMLTAYDDAVAAGEWIVIMMWSPHFAYAKWDGDQAVTDLADPGDEVDGETMYLYKDQSDAAHIYTLVNADFESQYPEAAEFLKRFQVSAEEEAAMMLEVNAGKTVKQVAHEFLAAHPEKVAAWLGK